MAKEANEGSQLCVERIKQLLDLDTNTQVQQEIQTDEDTEGL